MPNDSKARRCNRCHGTQALTRHHIVPRSAGGGDAESNIERLCRPCHEKEHRARPRQRAMTRAQKLDKKRLLRLCKASLEFDCRPGGEKCSNCAQTCVNLVLELLILFFLWMDEATREACGRGTIGSRETIAPVS